MCVVRLFVIKSLRSKTHCGAGAESQYLRFEVYDHDKVNITKALKLNVLRGATEVFGSVETIAKGEVNLRDACIARPGEVLERWFSLGTEDWSADDGPVRLRLLMAGFCFLFGAEDWSADDGPVRRRALRSFLRALFVLRWFSLSTEDWSTGRRTMGRYAFVCY